MIRIVTVKTLDGLRAEAGLVPGLRSAAEEATRAQQEAEEARLAADAGRGAAEAAQARAEAERAAALDGVIAGLARLELAAGDPVTGESVRAGIALHVLRQQFARIKAAGDAAAIDSIRVVDMLIGQGDDPGPPAVLPAPATARETAAAKDRDQEDQPVTPDPIDPFHHRNFISVERGPDGLRYSFRPFSGWEDEPQVPEATREALTWDDRQRLSDEYEGARVLWHRARFAREVTPVIEEAVPAWQAHVQARSVMVAEYAAFSGTVDNHWRAQVLRLVTAHEQALAAAEAWDLTAARLARLHYEHYLEVGSRNALPLRDFAAGGAGIDISDWEISFYHDRYDDQRRSYSHPATEAVRTAIGAQKDRLRAVGELAPALAGQE